MCCGQKRKPVDPSKRSVATPLGAPPRPVLTPLPPGPVTVVETRP